MLVNPFDAWRRPIRNSTVHGQPSLRDVVENDSILTGITVGSLATEVAPQTPVAVNVFASGRAPELSGMVPSEGFDEQQRHRLAGTSPPDDRLCGDIEHFLKSNPFKTVIYGGYENGEPTRLVVSFADQADEIAAQIGKMLLLESSAGPASEHGAIHAQVKTYGD